MASHSFIDPEEAREVVRLAASRGVTQEGPTIEGLAEALGTSPDEVQRLLAEVRARRQVPMASPVARRQFGDRSAALSAGIVLALVILIGLLGAGFMYARGQMSNVITPAIDVSEVPAPPIAPEFNPVPDSALMPPDTTIIDSDGSKTTIKTNPDGKVEIRSEDAPKSSGR